VSSSYAIFAENANNATTANSATSASFAASATSASFASTAAQATSASFATSASTANTATSAGSATTATSASFAETASFASTLATGLNLTASNILINNDLVVNGTASFGYTQTITGSAVIIGEEFIILNAAPPAARYAGIQIYDSGSSATASFEWDGNIDSWIIVEETGLSAGILTGLTGSKGSEVYPSNNRLIKGSGNHTVSDSSITDNGTSVSINSNTLITGSLKIADVSSELQIVGNGFGQASLISPNGALVLTPGLYGVQINGTYPDLQVNGNVTSTGANSYLTGSLLGTASFATNANTSISSSFATNANTATSASFATNANTAISSSFATNASTADSATTASYVLNAVSASFATTASFASTASFVNTLSQELIISGSVRGEVKSLSISSNTASLDLSLGNFFTLTLVSGSNTFINPSNIRPGQTVNIRITQANPGNGTVSFPSSVDQVSGSAYVASVGSGPVDIVTLISFDTSSLYLSNVKNLV
jgi:hypothetical protein